MTDAGTVEVVFASPAICDTGRTLHKMFRYNWPAFETTSGIPMGWMDEHVINVVCPRCDAFCGLPCRTATGNAVRRPHEVRYERLVIAVIAMANEIVIPEEPDLVELLAPDPS